MSDMLWPSSIRFGIPSMFAVVLPEIWEIELLPLLSLVDIYALALVDKKTRIFITMLIKRKAKMRGADVETLTALLVNRFRPARAMDEFDPWCFDVFNQLRFERLADLSSHLITRACHCMTTWLARPLSWSLRNVANIHDATWMLDTLAAHWLPIDVVWGAIVLSGRTAVFAHRPRWVQYLRSVQVLLTFAILSNEMAMFDLIYSIRQRDEPPAFRLVEIAAALGTSDAMVARVFPSPPLPPVERALAKACYRFPGATARLALLYPDEASQAIIAGEYRHLTHPFLL
jgi:hypothetical protein